MGSKSRNAYKGAFLFGNLPDKIVPMPSPRTEKGNFGIPGSFTLHVGPSACGRRFSVSSYQRGTRHNRAHLYIDETDIVTGCYEDLIPDAVEEVLETAKPTPRAIFITVTCIDDLLGTDHSALLDLLRRRFPDTRFAIQPIDPIRLGQASHPRVYIMCSTFGMLDPADGRDDAVNSIGHDVPLSPQSELPEVMRLMGLDTRTTAGCETFDDFLAMSRSRLNLAVTGIGRMAAEDMEERLGIPYIYAPTPYGVQAMASVYDQAADILGVDRPDYSPWKETAEQAVQRALEKLDDAPIVIDGSFRATALAHDLLDYGFNVALVIDNFIIDGDTSHYEWIRANHPEVDVVPGILAEGHPLRQRADELVCIGFGGAYLMGAKHAVFFLEDETRYGFGEIANLMNALADARGREVDLGAVMAESEGGCR